jgi:preprotein translocase subunit YajC
MELLFWIVLAIIILNFVVSYVLWKDGQKRIKRMQRILKDIKGDEDEEKI